MASTVSNSVPFAIPAGAGTMTWNKITAGNLTTYGIASNNYLFAWGSSTSGQLGDGTIVARSSPVQVGVTYNETSLNAYALAAGLSLNSWTQIASGLSTMAGLASDGSLWTWGLGSQGELGLNTAQATSNPTKLGTSSWSAVTAGVTHFAAIRSDGGLFTWGYNISGQLGLNDTLSRSSPVQVGTNSYTSVSAGAVNTAAIDTSYTLWTWGDNTNGQLGVGDIVSRSNPVQVGFRNSNGYFSGSFNNGSSGDYLSVPSIASSFGTGNFTIEAWIYKTGSTTAVVSNQDGGTDNNYFVFDAVNAQLTFQIRDASSQAYAYGPAISDNTWTHVAVSRSSGSVIVFVNGVGGTPVSITKTITTRNTIVAGFLYTGFISYFSGYISNLRIIKGSALYTSNFTPPTSPLTAVSGTSLLTCQSQTFIDNSSNSYQITISGVSSTKQYIIPFSDPPGSYIGPSWTQVSTGSSVTTAINSTGNLFTWGASAAGQLGQGLLVHRSSPVQVSTFAGNESQITAYATAVGYSGTVYSSWTKITSGTTSDLAIRSDGTLWGWGVNTDGSLGLNTTASNISYPVPIGSSSWTQIYTNDGTTYGIRTDGALFSWGLNTFGSLGTNDVIHRSSPVQIGTSSWTALATGGIRTTGVFTLALRSDGALFAWGFNSLGQLGLNDAVTRSSPVQVGTSSWTNVSVGASNTMAIRSGGGLFTWGDNTNGQLGSLTRTHRSSPVQVGASSWSAIASGFNHNIALLSTGALFTWGIGATGQLGSLAIATRSSPVQVGASSWSSVGAGTSWSFAIRTDNGLFSWGANTAGNLGDGTVANKSSPVQIGTSSWTLVTSVTSNSAPMAIRSDGRLFTWGQQYNGDPSLYPLPNLRFTAQSSPVVVTAYVESFTSVSTGTSHLAVIRKDGALWAWGLNTSGQLGDGTIVSRSSPAQIGTSSWTSVAAGGTHTIALNTSSYIFGWGLNTSGQVGDSTLVSRSSPVQIGTVAWSSLKASLTSSYALKPNYTLYGWGANNGQFGSLGLQGNQNSPVTIATIADSWNSIGTAITGLQTLGIRSDALLFTWGSNSFGQLGLNDILNRSNPTQVGSGTPNGYYSNLFNGASGLTLPAGSMDFVHKGLTDWTIECWFNSTTSGTLIGTSIASVNIGFFLGIGNGTAGNIDFQTFNGTSGQLRRFTSAGSLWSFSSWYHVAVVNIASSNTTTIYLNGVSVATTSATYTYSTSTATTVPTLAKSPGTASGYITGSVSNMRVLNNTALYTSNFTPPTSPLTAIANTTLLTCQSSAFVDNSTNGYAVSLVGSPAISTQYPSSFTAPAGSSGYTSWSMVASGNASAAGLTTTNNLFTWGVDNNGQLGIESGIVNGGAWLVPRSSPTQVGTVTYAASPVQIGSSSWTSINSGSKHALAIRADNTLWSWGLNTNGQLGLNDITPRSSPVQVGTGSWSQISGGDSHSLAIASNSTLYGWGLNSIYQVGDGTQVHRSSPVQISTSSWSQVSAGFSHSLALKTNSTMWGWGGSAANTFTTYSWKQMTVGTSFSAAIRSDGALFTWGGGGAALGLNDSAATRSSPVQVGTSSWTLISAGSFAMSAIRSDGGLFTWGSNGGGQLGDGTIANRSSPVQIGTSSWTMVSMGDEGTTAGTGAPVLAIRADGSLWSWGRGDSGQMGDNTTATRSSPVQVTSGSWSVVSAVSRISMYAIRSDGALFAWGAGAAGSLGDNTIVNKSNPTVLTSFNNETDMVNYANANSIPIPSWTQVSSGVSHTLMLRSDGKLFSMGGNGWGQTGDTPLIITFRNYYAPVGNSSWTMISAGSSYSMAIRADNTLWGWGANANGCLGDNTIIDKSSPVQIGTSSWSQISAGNFTTLGVRTDGVLFTWGLNVSGQLGLSDTLPRSSPTQVGTSSWASVGAGLTHMTAILSNGALFTWGWGGNGQLGTGAATDVRSSPVQVSSMNTVQDQTTYASYLGYTPYSWSQISSNTSHIVALRSDKLMFAWGLNTNGQLGINNTVNQTVPNQIGNSSWTSISTGTSYSMAIRTDGTLWTWGYNTVGALGLFDTVHRSSPVQVGTSSWSVLSSNGFGSTNTGVIRSDGALFTWGENTSGQLGLGDRVHRSSPVQVGASSWTTLSVGGTVFAIRIDGSLFGFGSGATGTIGDGFVAARSSPVQIGTSSWSQVSAGLSSMIGIRADGALFTWGGNSGGQLGDGTAIARSSPVQIGTSSWVSVAGGAGYAQFAIRSDGALFTWGTNSVGQAGLGDSIARSSPTQVGTSSWALTASSNTASSIGLDINRNMFTWGGNGNGLLGTIKNYGTTNVPIFVATVNDSWSVIGSRPGTSFGMVIRSDKTLWAWGYNGQGNLGTNDTTNKSNPTQIGANSWLTITSGSNFALGVTVSNTLFAWGINTGGQLGLDDLVARSSPTQIGATGSWNSLVAAGNAQTFAYRKDNLLFGWGLNTSGQLGTVRNAPSTYSSPVVVMTVFDSWSTVASSNSTGTNNAFALAIRTDGTLFTWGFNSLGALGQNDIVNKSAPTQVGVSSWISVAATSYNGLALKTDNTLWIWGGGNSGTTGLNDQVHRSSPTQIGTYTWYSMANGPYQVNGAIRQDRILFDWGPGASYNLGQNDGVSRSSPTQLGTMSNYISSPLSNPVITQIGSSSWTNITAGNNYSMAVRATDSVLFGWGFNPNTTLSGSLSNLGYSAAAVNSGTSHFGFVKK